MSALSVICLVVGIWLILSVGAGLYIGQVLKQDTRFDDLDRDRL